MDQHRFTDLKRSLRHVPSRRDVLRGLASSGLGLGALRLSDVAESRKKRKSRKKKKPQPAPQPAPQPSPRPAPQPAPNAFGCLEVGDSCTSAAQCCSGICEGQPGKETCQAHDTGGCTAGVQPETCGGTNVACTTSLGSPGTCATTTGNAGYCLTAGDCFACKTDIDCQTLLDGQLGPHAACIRCAKCTQTGGAACAAIFNKLPI